MTASQGQPATLRDYYAIVLLRDVTAPYWVATVDAATPPRIMALAIRRPNDRPLSPRQCQRVTIVGSVIDAAEAFDCLNVPPLLGSVCDGEEGPLIAHADLSCGGVGWAALALVDQGVVAKAQIGPNVRVTGDANDIGATTALASAVFPNAEAAKTLDESDDLGLSQVRLPHPSSVMISTGCAASVVLPRASAVHTSAEWVAQPTRWLVGFASLAVAVHVPPPCDGDNAAPTASPSFSRTIAMPRSSLRLTSSSGVRSRTIIGAVEGESPASNPHINGTSGRLPPTATRRGDPISPAPRVVPSRSSRQPSVTQSLSGATNDLRNASNGGGYRNATSRLVAAALGTQPFATVSARVAVGGLAVVALATAASPFVANRATTAGRIAGLGERCQRSVTGESTGGAGLVPDQLSFVWVPAAVQSSGPLPANVDAMVQVAVVASVVPQLAIACALYGAWTAGWGAGTMRGAPRSIVTAARAVFAVALNYYGPNVVGLSVAAMSTDSRVGAGAVAAVAFGIAAEVGLTALVAVVIVRTGRGCVPDADARPSVRRDTLAACLSRPLFAECRMHDLDRIVLGCRGIESATTTGPSIDAPLLTLPPRVATTVGEQEEVIPEGIAPSEKPKQTIIPSVIALYGIVDLAVAYAQAVLSSFAYTSEAGCKTGVLALFVVSAAHLAYQFAVRPISTTSLRATVAASFLTAANAVFALGLFVVLVSSSSSAAQVDAYLGGASIVLQVLFYGQAVAEVAGAIFELYRRNNRKQDASIGPPVHGNGLTPRSAAAASAEEEGGTPPLDGSPRRTVAIVANPLSSV